jgi:hypothetical protein
MAISRSIVMATLLSLDGDGPVHRQLYWALRRASASRPPRSDGLLRQARTHRSLLVVNWSLA